MKTKKCSTCDNIVRYTRTFCDDCNIQRKIDKSAKQIAERSANRLDQKKDAGNHVDLSKWTRPMGSKRKK